MTLIFSRTGARTAGVNNESSGGRHRRPVALALLVVACLVFSVVSAVTQASSARAATTTDVTAAPYSAVGDGVTNDRPAIQAAIEDVSAAGGGVVVLPAGYNFLTGGLELRDGVTLQIDGTITQSQVESHYPRPVARGHDIDGTVMWNHAWLDNYPLIYGGGVSDVGVVGQGTIQMTRPAGEFIRVSPIGFFEATNFEVRDISILYAAAYNIAIFTSSHGIVDGVNIDIQAGYGSADGISVMNSSDLTITNNDIYAGDDGIYFTATYADPRGGSWWDADNPQPTKNSEVSGNNVRVDCCKAFAFIAWGGPAPDQNAVAISNVNVHDNRLQATEAVGCWCSNVYVPGSKQSLISDVTIVDNEYVGATNVSMADAKISNFTNDIGLPSIPAPQNDSFELGGLAGWATAGDVEFSASPANSAVLTGAGSQIMQGISAGGGERFDRFEVQADVSAAAGTAQLFAIDTCTDTRYEATNSSSARGILTLDVSIPSECGNVRIGLDNVGTGDPITLYSLKIDDGLILATDPLVQTTGDWLLMPNAAALGGAHLLNHPPIAGPTLTVTFTGSRAIMWGGIDNNLGTGTVLIDGVEAGTINFYSPTLHVGIPLFDSGPLTPGEHTFELVANGGYVVFNALYTRDDSPVITSGALPNGQIDQPYAATVTATGDGPLEFAATGLPAGLTIDSATGAISGTPTTAASAEVTITVTNDLGSDTAEHTVVIDPAPVVVPVVTTIELEASALSVAKGGSLTFTAVAYDADGDEIGDITDEVEFESSVATDVIDGNVVTFPTASPHTITARHLPTGLTSQVTVEVVAGSVPAVLPPSAAPVTASPSTTLPLTGSTSDLGGWMGAALLLMLLGASLVVIRRRRTVTEPTE